MIGIENLKLKISESTSPKKDFLLKYLFDRPPAKPYLRMLNDSMIRMDQEGEDKDWLKSKVDSILTESDERNISGLFGELRAHASLKSIFRKLLVCRSGKGADFEVTLDGKRVLIEVNTPSGASKERVMEHGSSSYELKHLELTTKISEEVPFGFPSRKIDTVNSEAISAFAQIKASETQFEEDACNILWVDLLDPILQPLDLLSNQVEPYSDFNESISWGCIWHAFYSKKGDQIYDRLTRTYMSDSPYQMEYDGRFQRSSKINLVLFSTQDKDVLFQNPMRNVQDGLLTDYLFKMERFSIVSSWLQWPNNDLVKEIENTRILGQELSKHFDERRH